MVSVKVFKSTFLFCFLSIIFCGNAQKTKDKTESHLVEKNNFTSETSIKTRRAIINGAENYGKYIPLLKNKKVGIVTNQTGIVFKEKKNVSYSQSEYETATQFTPIHLVDYLIKDKKINITKIYALEHGFRGTADAGEFIKDGKDTTTKLPVISLYGNNKKPNKEQLKEVDVMVFDLQDVGTRFFTYISSLHYVMESCAENKIPLIILDRPNPNGNIIDGPILEIANKSFVGMHVIPVLHGMTIGEYGQMINGEKWLKKGIQCDLTVVSCLNYTKQMSYSLPVKPSPNLPNDQSINLYPSLCFFEGTNISVGRGTNKQFQIYGSPYLQKGNFFFTPKPNPGSKKPLHNGKICYGENLSDIEKVTKLEIKWLLKAYQNTSDKKSFFNDFFLKLAGTKLLRQQIEQGLSESQIRKSWEHGLNEFRKMRKSYLIYPE